MPINQRAESFREEATGIAARLVDSEQMTDPETLARDVREGLYIGDVLQEAAQFLDEVTVLRALELPFPAIRVGNRNVPVALVNYFPYLGPPLPWVPPPWLGARLRSFFPEEALRYFVDFLATRIASVAEFFGQADRLRVPLTLPRTWLGITLMQTVGFKVDVHTSTSGLRVHVSSTFHPGNWRYFGMPTTPIISTLTGGIYQFGADGGPYATIKPDAATFDIPYKTLSPRLTL